MNCPVCKKKVLKGKQYAERRKKIKMANGRPRLVHVDCYPALAGIGRLLQATGHEIWEGITIRELLKMASI